MNELLKEPELFALRQKEVTGRMRPKYRNTLSELYLFMVSLTGGVSNDWMSGEWWVYKDVVESDRS